MALPPIQTEADHVTPLDRSADTDRRRFTMPAHAPAYTPRRDTDQAPHVTSSVRSDIAALAAANQRLGTMQGLLSTTLIGLDTAVDQLASLRGTLLSLSDPSVTGDTRTDLLARYDCSLAALEACFMEAQYEGTTLLDGDGNTGDLNVVPDDGGSAYHIGQYGASSVRHRLSAGEATSAAAFASLAATSGSFLMAETDLGAWCAAVSNQVSDMNNFIAYNATKIDVLNRGLGSLVDADLAAESANLSALQLRQQLATQALPVSNATPSALLSLFR